MPDPKRAILPSSSRRAPAALDDVSDHMGEVLRRADDLLVEWGRFGAEVRAQVDRETQQIGSVVTHAIEGAVARTTTAGVDRAMTEQIGAKLSALATEIGRLEGRARAASRAIVEERAADRRILFGVAAGILVANGLLVALLLKTPDPVVITQPAAVAEPVRIETPVIAPVDAAPAPEPEPVKPEPAPVSSAKDTGSAAAAAKPPIVKPNHAAAPLVRPAKIGPPAGQPKKR